MHTHLRTYTHTHTHQHSHAYTYTHTHTHLRTYTSVPSPTTHTHAHTLSHTCTDTHTVSTHTHIRTLSYAQAQTFSVFVCLFVFETTTFCTANPLTSPWWPRVYSRRHFSKISLSESEPGTRWVRSKHLITRPSLRLLYEWIDKSIKNIQNMLTHINRR